MLYFKGRIRIGCGSVSITNILDQKSEDLDPDHLVLDPEHCIKIHITKIIIAKTGKPPLPCRREGGTKREVVSLEDVVKHMRHSLPLRDWRLLTKGKNTTRNCKL